MTKSNISADYYPRFQFDAGLEPLPAMHKLLPLLATRLTNWQIALWFTSSNPLQGHLRPADLLSSQPEDVLLAARAAIPHK